MVVRVCAGLCMWACLYAHLSLTLAPKGLFKQSCCTGFLLSGLHHFLCYLWPVLVFDHPLLTCIIPVWLPRILPAPSPAHLCNPSLPSSCSWLILLLKLTTLLSPACTWSICQLPTLLAWPCLSAITCQPGAYNSYLSATCQLASFVPAAHPSISLVPVFVHLLPASYHQTPFGHLTIHVEYQLPSAAPTWLHGCTGHLPAPANGRTSWSHKSVCQH